MEFDETLVGGVSVGMVGASSDKVPVMVAVEKVAGGRKLGRIRLEIAEGPGTLELVEFAQRMVAPGSTIRTDGAIIPRENQLRREKHPDHGLACGQDRAQTAEAHGATGEEILIAEVGQDMPTPGPRGIGRGSVGCRHRGS